MYIQVYGGPVSVRLFLESWVVRTYTLKEWVDTKMIGMKGIVDVTKGVRCSRVPTLSHHLMVIVCYRETDRYESNNTLG